MTSREYDIIYGLHSNIPVCCIIFFLSEWHLENKRNSPYAKAVHMSLYNYIPCPECFAWKRKNTLRLCDEQCGKKCHEEIYNRPLTDEERQQIKAVELEADCL